MTKINYLKEAFTLNATRQKVSAIAEPVHSSDVINQKNNFSFNLKHAN